MELVYVGGGHGVGKTTILKELSTSIQSHKNECCIVYGSQLVAQIAKYKFGFNWSTELGISRQTQKIENVREYAVEYLAKLPHKLVILDSHYVEMSSGTARCIVSDQLKKLINTHILIEAPPELILRRRIMDTTKTRDIDINMLRKEVDSEKKTAISISTETCKPLYILQNIEPVETSKKLFSILRM